MKQGHVIALLTLLLAALMLTLSVWTVVGAEKEEETAAAVVADVDDDDDDDDDDDGDDEDDDDEDANVDVFDAFARARASAEAKAAGQQQEQQKKKSNIQEIKLWKSPPVRGSVVMFEGFDDGLRDWHLSANPKFSGTWKVTTPSALPGILGDTGLVVSSPAQHHAIFRPFQLDNTGKNLVLQYEVKLQKVHECGGAYLKLVAESEGISPSQFDNETPYIIMFGPDKCGSNNKVHFILRHQNPRSGEWEEKHLTNPPTFPVDLKTHLYTLIIRQDNTFEILIDNKSVREGSLFEAFSPSINPPTEIDDPEDVKPDDWEDDARIPDPNAVKPEDWDESAPAKIPDPEDVKPEDWLDDEPLRIPAPAAKQPDNWDEDEDGEWQLPYMPNPKCASGKCGTWQPRMISNPAYKGKWLPPMIDNPRYKGVWKPRQIPNPNYFEDPQPSNLPRIAGLGIELWTMQDGIMFDNFFVGHDIAAAADYAERSFSVKRSIEDSREDEEQRLKASPDSDRKLFDLFSDMWSSKSVHDFLSTLNEALAVHPLPMMGLIFGLFVGLPLFLWKSFSRRTVLVDVTKISQQKPEEEEAAIAEGSKQNGATKPEGAEANGSSQEESEVREEQHVSTGSSGKGSRKASHRNRVQEEDASSS